MRKTCGWPFGSFRGSGNAILPIVSFGIFYVRGWGGNGGGNDDPCPGAIPNVPAGDLAGNFITHVADSATAQPIVAATNARRNTAGRQAAMR